MAQKAQCPDRRPHRPHRWWGPSGKPGRVKQVKYSCPGIKKEGQ